MAIEFARVRYVKRSDGGNVCRSSAYNGRADISCTRSGERFWFSHRGGLLDQVILLPPGADPGLNNPAKLWNRAQAAEKRKDAQEARELLLALPSDDDLNLSDWQVLTREFAREHFVSKGLAVQIDIHGPHEGERNVHAHLLITTRRLEGESFAKHKARDLDPEVRTGRRGRPVVAEGKAWGVAWRVCQNRYFERLGLEVRVDQTGIVPQRHEGPVRLRTVPEAASQRAAASRESNYAAAQNPDEVLAAVTRHRATFTELDIERQLRPHISDSAERQALRSLIIACPEVVSLHDRQSGDFTGRYTLRAIRQEEEDVLRHAAMVDRLASKVPVAIGSAATFGHELGHDQAAAVLRATGTDGLVLIDGLAGSGKSHSIKAIREFYEAEGCCVIGLAPTNTVAEDLRRNGFKRVSTVHGELHRLENASDRQQDRWDRRTCLVIDEAAMIDTRTLGKVMRRAAAARTKVILVGDDRQLSSIDRGGMFSVLKARHAGATIGTVRRQDADWQRTASEEFAGGRVAAGLRLYGEHGCLYWAEEPEEARARLLADWAEASRERPDIPRFVYASTNAEVDLLNAAIQGIRRQRGEVETGVPINTARGVLEIGTGDRVQFFANNRNAGFFNGTLGVVTSRRDHILSIRTDTDRVVEIDATTFVPVGLGYAGTIYRGQGKTTVEVQALYDNPFSWNARTAYVGMTRHRETVKLYVPRTLAEDEATLARQMARRLPDEASLTYLTAAEVVDLATVSRTNRDGMMREPENNRRRVEERGRPDAVRDVSQPSSRQPGADDEYRRELAAAELADRKESAAIESEQVAAAFLEEEAKRQRFLKEDADRQTRLAAEARLAAEREQAQLRQAQQTQPPLHSQFIQFNDRRAARAREETGIAGPEAAARARQMPPGDQDAFPASASVRYAEALARHYDGRNPYESLAQASLAETAAFKREQHELNRQIAIEADPARRDMLLMRRSIEHNDHMGQSWDRIAGTTKAVTGRSNHPDVLAEQSKAGEFKAAARDNRQEWERRCLDNPALYPPLNEEMRARVELQRETQLQRGPSGPATAAPGQKAPSEKSPADRHIKQEEKIAKTSDEKVDPGTDKDRRLAAWRTQNAVPGAAKETTSGKEMTEREVRLAAWQTDARAPAAQKEAGKSLEPKNEKSVADPGRSHGRER